MSKRTSVEFEGQMVPADELEITDTKEPWSMYTLEDGSTLKFKQNLVNIYKLVDKFRPTGEPIYVFKMAGLVDVVVAPELMKKAN